MKILHNNADLNEALKNVTNLGFVPTMGGLHEGHKSLIRKSLNYCKETIVSIFVNPKQFNNKNDFKRYPRNIKKDLFILKKMKIKFVYLPKQEIVYDYIRKKKISLKSKDKILCAKYRPGHFEGVIDVMDRLINQVYPQKIFMGEKDLQQLFLVDKYIKKKHKFKIITCKTVRNEKQLALSSRNILLNKKNLNKAELLIQKLFIFKKNLKDKKNIERIISMKKTELSNSLKIKIEYLELRNKFSLKKSHNIKNSNLFIAYYVNKIRLIDNL
tara:strand:+ start:1936 stop:2748 length:813 start_codon:yes stop_codon:yes gene_type:complete